MERMGGSFQILKNFSLNPIQKMKNFILTLLVGILMISTTTTFANKAETIKPIKSTELKIEKITSDGTIAILDNIIHLESNSHVLEPSSKSLGLILTPIQVIYIDYITRYRYSVANISKNSESVYNKLKQANFKTRNGFVNTLVTRTMHK